MIRCFGSKLTRGIREKALHRRGRVLRLVEYGQEMMAHWCSKGHVGHIVDGTIDIEFSARTITFTTGNAVFIPSGSQHAHRAIPQSERVLALFVEDR